MTSKGSSKQTGLVPAGNTQITNYSSALIKRGLETLARTRARTVSFPPDRSIGELFLIDSSKEWWKILQSVSTRGNKYFTQAQGTIHIPQDKWLILNMRPFASNVSALGIMNPKDLHGIVIGSRENLIDLSTLGLLTGLKILDLDFCAKSTNYDFLKKLTDLEALRINLEKEYACDQIMATISGMTLLKKLDLNLGHLNRYHVSKLAKGLLLNLNLLSVSGEFDNDEFRELANLTSINTLSLKNSLLTDAALPNLSRLTALVRLVLDSSRITDNGLKYLSRINNLRSLTVFSPVISDDGLKQLSKITGLIKLRLRCPSMTDEGLKFFSALPELTTLVLKSRSISNVGLFYLRNLPALKVIELHNTSVTDAAAKLFAEATGTKVTIAA